MSVIIIKHICFHNGNAVILGKRYIDCISIENYPIDSSQLGIFKAKTLSHDLEEWSIKEVNKKVFRMFFNDLFYMFPILHSLNF